MRCAGEGCWDRTCAAADAQPFHPLWLASHLLTPLALLPRATVAPKHTFGIKADVKDNICYLDEQTVLYPAGHNVVIFNTEQKTQRFISGTEKTEGITALAVSPNKKYVAVAERAPEGEKALVTVFDLHTLKRRKVRRRTPTRTVQRPARACVGLGWRRPRRRADPAPRAAPSLSTGAAGGGSRRHVQGVRVPVVLARFEGAADARWRAGLDARLLAVGEGQGGSCLKVEQRAECRLSVLLQPDRQHGGVRHG